MKYGYMPAHLAACLVLVCTFSLLALTTGRGVPTAQADDHDLLVGFSSSATNAQRSKAVQRSGGRITERLSDIDAVVVDTDLATNRLALKNRLIRSSMVEYVEPDYDAAILLAPNDPDFNSLWGLYNSGQLGGTADADIDATDAWDRLTSTGNLVVAVIDTGIDDGHPDLAGNIWANPGEVPANLLDDDFNGYADDVYGYDFVNGDADPDDDHSHGTHLAGTIGAVGNNGAGVVGVAWSTRLMAVKFADQNGLGSTSNAIRSINYAVDNGAQIINASWGVAGYSQSLYNAIANARDQGVLFVAGAGNSSANMDLNPSYPASYDLDNIVSVGSNTRNETLSSFSNYGASSVDLAAPGSTIFSTLPSGAYGNMSGTSMSAPHVSGAAALYLTENPGTQPSALRQMLVQTADLGAAYQGITVSGGRLNAFRLLKKEANPPAESPPVTSPPAEPSDGGGSGEPEEVLKLLQPKPNSTYSIPARRNTRRVAFRWSSIDGISEYRLYLKGKRARDGSCYRTAGTSLSNQAKRSCYRLQKRVRDPDSAGPRQAKTKSSLRLRAGKYRYLVIAVTTDGEKRRGRYELKKHEKVLASVNFKVVSARSASGH